MYRLEYWTNNRKTQVEVQMATCLGNIGPILLSQCNIPHKVVVVWVERAGDCGIMCMPS